MSRYNIRKNEKYPISRTKAHKVLKHENLNSGIFPSDFGLGTYRVYLLLSTLIHKELKCHDTESIPRSYTLSAKEYSSYFGTTNSVSYRILKNSIDHLLKAIITLKSIGKNKIIKINLCSKAEYNQDEGEIFVKFTDDIMPFLTSDFSKYTFYDLRFVAPFKSLYSLRIFELIWGFKHIGYREFLLSYFREIFNIQKKFLRFGHFRLRVLDHAVNEINEHHPFLELKVETFKNGNRVEKIKFVFRPVLKGDGCNSIEKFTKYHFKNIGNDEHETSIINLE